MNALLSLCLFAAPAAPNPAKHEPRSLVGDELPAGAVARYGPNAFRYAGAVAQMQGGLPTTAYSHDGKRVAATSTCGAGVWDANTGKRLLWLPAHDGTEVGVLGFHPNGDLIVRHRLKYDDNGGVFRFDPLTGKLRAKLQPDEDRRFNAVSPDGKVAFSRTQVNDSEAENVATEIDTGKELWRRKMPGMSWMRPSPDGSRLVVWSSRAAWEVETLDAATGQTLTRFASNDIGAPTWTSGGIAIGPKAERVVAAHGWNRGFTVLEGGEKVAFRQPEHWDGNAFLTNEGKRAVVIREGKRTTVDVWDLDSHKRLSSVEADVRGSIALSPDGSALVNAGYRLPHLLQFFDVETGKRLPRSPEPFAQAEVVWFLPDGTLASSDRGFANTVRWDVKTGAMTALPAGTKPEATPKVAAQFAPPVGTTELRPAPGGARVLGFRLDPEDLDSAPGDTYLGLFDARGAVLKKFARPDNTGGAVYGFAPDGKTFVVARGDGTVTQFDAADGKELRVFRAAGGCNSLAFSPDGSRLATNHADGPIIVWDLKPAK